MLFHSLYILKLGGVPIYHRNFSHVLESTDKNLLSSFLTAILDFSQGVVKKRLNIMEIGDLRFFFYNIENKFIAVFITNITASLLLVKERFKLVKEALFEHIQMDELINFSGQVLEIDGLDKAIDKIVSMAEDDVPEGMEDVKDVFEREIMAGEISAGSLISIEGDIFYSSLPMEDLHFALKELEIRAQAQTEELKILPKSIWQSGNKMIFSQVVQSQKIQKMMYVILLFETGTSLGMADYALEDVVKKLHEIL